jgi:tetratricopeptide (TPR) repeat protein
MSEEARDRAHAHFEAGEFRAALRAAQDGLAAAPDDVELLVLAGRAAIELDSDDAVTHLRRATELAPQDADAWRHLGEALAAEGRMEEADAAFRRTVELDPEDLIALTHLGHTSVAAGRSEEGVQYLARAADDSPTAASSASISLVDMYRSFGELDKALTQARAVAEAVPDDPLTAFDVADLSLQLERYGDAAEAFDRLRGIDDVPGHEVFPVHGLLAVAVARGDWATALQLARQVSAIDPQGLGRDVANLALERTGERSPGSDESAAPVPTEAEVADALAASLADYRRMLADDRRLSGGERDG